MNPNEPLGLPRGSVRALLALIVTIFCGTFFLIHQTFPTELVALETIVTTFYFVKRTDDDVRSPAALVEPPLAEPYIPPTGDPD